MARADKDTMQDNILNGFEKSNRNNTTSKPLTLAEQIAAADAEENQLRHKTIVPKKEEEITYGNLDYDTYLANKKIIDAKNEGKRRK